MRLSPSLGLLVLVLGSNGLVGSGCTAKERAPEAPSASPTGSGAGAPGAAATPQPGAVKAQPAPTPIKEPAREASSAAATSGSSSPATGAAPELPSCGPCDAPSFCHQQKCVPGGTAVVSTTAGTGPDQFRISRAGDEIGPMSLTATEDGQVYVLDQENDRILGFRDGKLAQRVPLEKGSTYQDLVVYDAATWALLENTHRPRVDLVDADGKVTASYDLKDPKIGLASQELHDVDMLLRRPDGLWLQSGEFAFQLLDASGQLGGRRLSGGRYTADGKHLLSVRRDGQHLLIQKRSVDGTVVLTHRVDTGAPLQRPWEVDTDARGRTYVIVTHEPSPGQRLERLLVLDEKFGIQRNVPLRQAGGGVVGFNRWFHVTPAGALYAFSTQGEQIQVRRY